MPAPSEPSAAALGRALLNPAEVWRAGIAGTENRTARALLETEAAGGRWQRSVYELFAEMEEKDGHLYATLQTRLNGLLGLPRTLQEPATEDARRVAEVFHRIPRFDALLRALLDGIAKGFAVVELIWEYDAAGRLVIADWIAHPQEYFLFGDRGELLLASPPFAARGIANAAPANSAVRAVRPPARKFLVLQFGRDSRNLYGRGLTQRAYWLYWFKKNCLKWWSIANERFGAPTAIATTTSATTEDERAALLEALEALQTDAGIVVPDSVRVEFLDAAARNDGGTFRALADWCNDEISKIVLGATLTSGEGRRSGSLALGRVHDAVRQDYVEADARLLESVVNGDLLRWIAELNASAGTEAPLWSIDVTPPADLEQQVRIDRELIALGLALPESQLRARYGRPAPKAGEAALRYDDANLFQYHLRYGILTINEVRARLHMPPVPWGNARAGEPAAAAGAPPSGGGAEGTATGERSGTAREDNVREGREQPTDSPEAEPYEP